MTVDPCVTAMHKVRGEGGDQHHFSLLSTRQRLKKGGEEISPRIFPLGREDGCHFLASFTCLKLTGQRKNYKERRVDIGAFFSFFFLLRDRHSLTKTAGRTRVSKQKRVRHFCGISSLSSPVREKARKAARIKR